jgi:hypothetical protein
MTVKIDDFDGVDWNLDSIGPEVLEGSTFSRIDRKLLAGGRPSSVVGGMRIRWLRGEKAMHSAFMSRLQSRGGHAFSDLERLAEEPCQAIREAERRIPEKATDLFGTMPAPFSFEEGPKLSGHHVAMLSTPLPEGAWEAYKIYKQGAAEAEEAKTRCVQTGRILVVVGTRAGWELISPDSWMTDPIDFSSGNEWRFVFSGDLPRDLRRESGRGPRSDQDRRSESAAKAWLSEIVKEAERSGARLIRGEVFLEMASRFPGLSHRAKERIWQNTATPEVRQRGRPKLSRGET